MTPAFPTAMNQTEGLTIRDYFAARAMEGMFARDQNRKLVVSAEENARTAYEWADAMLKARDEQQAHA